MDFIWALIVGGVIGWLGEVLVGRELPGGIIGNVVFGIIGAWVGQRLLPNWGPSLAGMALLPSILGAALVVFIVTIVSMMFARNR